MVCPAEDYPPFCPAGMNNSDVDGVTHDSTLPCDDDASGLLSLLEIYNDVLYQLSR